MMTLQEARYRGLFFHFTAMDTIHSWLSNAGAASQSARYKEAFNLYLRTATVIVDRLLTETTWGDDRVTRKPENTSELWRILQQCVRKGEEVLQVGSERVVDLRPARRRTETSADASQDLMEQPERYIAADLPLIPLSSVTKKLQWNKYYLQIAEGRYQESQQDRSDTSDVDQILVKTRRLAEDVGMYRSKVAAGQNVINACAAEQALLLTFKVDIFAREVARINVGLFASVDIRNGMVGAVMADEEDEHVKRCLDFRRYLTRILITAVLTATTPTEAVTFLLNVADRLFHAYRDLSGLSTILATLESPYIARLKSVWTRELREKLSQLREDVGNDTAQDQTDLVLQMLQYHSGHETSGLVVVPNLSIFHSEIHDIRNAYATTIDRSSHQNGAALLTDIGTRALEDVIALLERCQGRLQNSRSREPATSSSNQQEGIDLSRLPSDPMAEHWILTRVYWSARALWDWSTSILPQDRSESIPSEVATDGKTSSQHIASRQANPPQPRTGDYMDRYLGDISAEGADENDVPVSAAIVEDASEYPILQQLASLPTVPSKFPDIPNDEVETIGTGDYMDAYLGPLDDDVYGFSRDGADSEGIVDAKHLGSVDQFRREGRPLDDASAGVTTEGATEAGANDDGTTQFQDSHEPRETGELDRERNSTAVGDVDPTPFDYMDQFLGPTDLRDEVADASLSTEPRDVVLDERVESEEDNISNAKHELELHHETEKSSLPDEPISNAESTPASDNTTAEKNPSTSAQPVDMAESEVADIQSSSPVNVGTVRSSESSERVEGVDQIDKEITAKRS
ncbi:hypothetical protein BC832DRAFT_553245 [Gaertneriomyces semiglobifer]|nr:hypothetical protein BC832DRAFT_553245 [Gaertneriomyces semiglobifer]